MGLELKEGKLHVEADMKMDKDGDGKASIEGKVLVMIDPAEAINEIAKKDMTLLEAILKQVNYSKS